jgi:hypothetical protein
MQTIVTTSSSLPGQQQQASSSVTTGVWTAPPQAYRTGGGVTFKISTAQGEHFIHIQGSRVSVMGQSPSLGTAQQVQVQQTSTVPESSMQPMQPMQPMKMGDMEMKMNPMEMRMGNMEMRMGSAGAAGRRRFCSKCGAKVDPGDRFCSSCGNALS